MHARQFFSPFETGTTVTDDEIADAVCLALQNTGYLQIQNLQVRVDEHDVYLRGLLPSYFLKQIAQQVVMGVPGVKALIDDIDVVN